MKKHRRARSAGSKYIMKWLWMLSVFLIIGGTFAFGLLAFLASVFTGDQQYDPIWMLGMIPLMCVIATPINILINDILSKHMDTLSESMKAVANGESNVYIPTAHASAFTDIYEDFNKMAGEIESVQVLRTEMLNGFSHELKTPLASINGFSRLLLEEDLDEEKRKKYLEIIVKESDRLSVLAKNTLMLSKIDATEIVSDKTVYDLAAQIRDCTISLENDWSAKNIELSADLVSVDYEGNANLMESLWLNLLSNAIKFTPARGEIHIGMETDQDHITVTVTDNGIGMSREVAARIFERYYQGDASHAASGHGLGLSIAKRIVKLCGGTISVESGEGEGSTFTVCLPR